MKRLTTIATIAAALVAAGCVSPSSGPSAPSDTIEIFGPYRGLEADRFVETLRPFTAATGIHVRYVGSVDFVNDLRHRAGEGNDPPDVAIIPQLGLVRQFADDGELVPLADDTVSAMSENYRQPSIDLSTIEGTPYVVPFRVTVKSLVWYRPEVFAEHGWAVPRSLDELDELAGRIQADTDLAPWCFTMGAGSATGWTATDWAEDLLLRTAGQATYDSWAAGTTRFDDPDVADAFERFRSLVLQAGRVYGGLAGVVATPVDEAVLPLFQRDGCAMYKQADFATSWLPDGTSFGPDGDVNWFVLPGVDASTTPPVLLGGDTVAQFRRSSDIDALMTYLAGPEAGRSWVHHGGFISPKSSIAPEDYPDTFGSAVAAIAGSAEIVGYDASDQMPPDVGSSLLWNAITDWVTGVTDYPTFAAIVDDARDPG